MVYSIIATAHRSAISDAAMEATFGAVNWPNQALSTTASRVRHGRFRAVFAHHIFLGRYTHSMDVKLPKTVTIGEIEHEADLVA
jgi:hypothetical protein